MTGSVSEDPNSIPTSVCIQWCIQKTTVECQHFTIYGQITNTLIPISHENDMMYIASNNLAEIFSVMIHAMDICTYYTLYIIFYTYVIGFSFWLQFIFNFKAYNG